MKRYILTILAAVAIVLTGSAQMAPKYIFYFIGDGMGTGQVMAAYQYNRMVRNMEVPLLLTSFPVISQSTTYSANRPVTDSAAAGTALATGSKTKNGMLGMNADTVAVTSIATKLHNNGYGIGILSTVALDDATPGAFYAHQPTRKNYYEIAVEAASSNFEFMAGPGFRGARDKKGNPTDIFEIYERNNISVVRGAEAMRGVNNTRVILLNTDTVVIDQVGYTIDSIPGSLTLPVMTKECLSHLENVSPDRFFMMVEGGNIDWAGHANDGATVIKEILKFDEALRVAYDFYLAHPDETLIVVTADHETGGMATANNFKHYYYQPKYADAQRISKDNFADYCRAILKSRRIYTWDDMEEYLRDNMGFWTAIPLGERQTEMLKDSFEKTFVNREGVDQESLYKTYPEFVKDVFGVMQDFLGIGWTSTAHSGNPVGVYAIGVGAQEFSGMPDNTEIPKIMLRLCGIEK